MNTIHTLLSTIRRRRSVRSTRPVSQASLWAQERFRHSMLGEPGIHEAARLFGVGR